MKKNKVEEDNWVRPEYRPRPEYNTDDFQPANFDKELEELTESVVEYLKYLKRKQSKPRFHGIFALMHGENK